jgi:dipeptidyl aminopeptidase/acylaminoacyl peptidase
MKAKHILMLLLLWMLCGSVSAQTVEPGSTIELAPNEGLALFDIQIDLQLRSIQLDRLGSIFSFPKIEDLPAGKYTRLLKLPAGEYRFKKFEVGFVFWEFEDVRNSKFKVEPGKINYVGQVRSYSQGWMYRSLAIENTAMSARANLERDFPGLLKRFPWRYTGEYADPFFDDAQRSGYASESQLDEVVEPAIDDRDVAEIFFRKFSTQAFGLSPDGKFVLQQVSEGQNDALNLFEIDAEKSRTLVAGAGIRSVQWVGNQHLALTLNKGTQKSILYEVKSSTEIKPIDLPAGAIWGVIPSSNQIIFYSTDRSRFVALDPKAGLTQKSDRKAAPIANFDRRAIDWWFDGTGEIRLAQLPSPRKGDHTRWVYYDVDTDAAIKFSLKQQKNQYFTIAGFDENGKILVMSNTKSERVELFEFDPSAQTLGRKVLGVRDADIKSVTWDVNHRVGSVSYIGKGRMMQLALSGATEQKLAARVQRALPDVNIAVSRTGATKRRLVHSEGPQDPGSAYVLELDSSQLRLFSRSAPHLEGRPLAKALRFVTRAKDGFEIESFLTKVDGDPAKKLPLLVLPHGGPFDVVDYQRFDSEVQYFAKLGFAVLQVNFRGSEAAEMTLARKTWGTTMISDIEAAVDEAIRKFPIDPQKIAALGTSYGGYGAVRLQQVNPTRYKAAVGICGVYDLPLLFHSGEGSRNERGVEWLKKHLGDPGSDLESMMQQSPVYGKSKLPGGILLVHDRGDTIAPFEHAIRLEAAMHLNGTRLSLIVVNDEQHGLVNSGTAVSTYPKIALFLRKELALW